MSALVILGAGQLGGAVARATVVAELARRVVLVDDARDAAVGKALDVRQAAPIDGTDVDVTGTADLAAVVGAAAIVVADRHDPAAEPWSGEAGLQLLARVRQLNPRATIVAAASSHLGLVERAVAEQEADRRRLVASAAEALRGGVAALVALEAACGPSDVSVAVLGRPPDAFVPWEQAAIAGRSAAERLAPVVIARLDARLARLWPPGPQACAAAATRVLRLVLARAPGTACVFGVPPGHVRGVMLPATFADGGAVLDVPPLSTRDRVRFEGALAR